MLHPRDDTRTQSRYNRLYLGTGEERMGSGVTQTVSELYSSEKWQAIEKTIDELMSWWRFLLLGAALAVAFAAPPTTGAGTVQLRIWLIAFAVYALLARWLSVAFTTLYDSTWVRIGRIHLDLAAIFVLMLLHPPALTYLWIFFSMRLLAAFRYFDGREWIWVYLLSCLAIIVATVVRAGQHPGPFDNIDIVAVIAKCAILGIAAWLFHYLHRLIPRLSNAEYLSQTSQLLMAGLDQGQIGSLMAQAAKGGIPAADDVIVHRVSSKENPVLIPDSSTLVAGTMLRNTPTRIGEGVIGWALEHRQSANVPDVAQDDRWVPLEPEGPKVVSLLVAPMYVGQRNLGTITAISNRRRAFDDRDEQYLMTVAGQAAVALANAELFSNRSRQRAQLGEILAASLTFDPCQPLDSLLNQLAEAVRKHSGYRMAAVNFIDPSDNTLRVAAMAGVPAAGQEHLARQRLPMVDLQPYLNDAYRISQSYYIRHDRRPAAASLDAYAWTPELGVRSAGEWHQDDMLLVPIMEQTGQVRGYLSVDDPIDRRTPSHDDVQMLEILARLVGSMSHTADLFARLAKQHEHERRHAQLHRLLHTISTVTPSLDSLDRMLHVYLTGITSNDGLGFNRVSLLQLEPGGAALSARMAIGQLEPQQARRIWENLVADHQSIENYLLSVRAGAHFEPTDLDRQLRGLRFVVSTDGRDAFSRALRERKLLFAYGDREPRLPPEYVEMAGVTTASVIVPLIVGSQVLGLLICDNKFTGAAPDNLDLLTNFASHIAAVMEDDRLRREAHSQASTAGWREGMQYERFRLQDDLHDALNWLLTGVKWEAELVEAHLEDGNTPKAVDATARLLSKVESACTWYSRILNDLRRPFLAEMGLMTALRQQEPALQAGQVQISGEVTGPLPPKVENELLRVGIEAMTNAAKHSGAKNDPDTRIAVRVRMEPDGVDLTVTDNGSGFDPAAVFAAGGDHGLCRMQKRVAEAGGHFQVMSKAGVGTEVRVGFRLDGDVGQRQG